MNLMYVSIVNIPGSLMGSPISPFFFSWSALCKPFDWTTDADLGGLAEAAVDAKVNTISGLKSMRYTLGM